MNEECVEETCPVALAVQILDGKWTMLVIRDLLGGTKRFSELRTSLAGISPKTLTDRLRSLEEHGVVRRVVHAEIPPRVEYTLTDTGLGLEPVLRALSAWGATLALTPVAPGVDAGQRLRRWRVPGQATRRSVPGPPSGPA